MKEEENRPGYDEEGDFRSSHEEEREIAVMLVAMLCIGAFLGLMTAGLWIERVWARTKEVARGALDLWSDYTGW